MKRAVKGSASSLERSRQKPCGRSSKAPRVGWRRRKSSRRPAKAPRYRASSKIADLGVAPAELLALAHAVYRVTGWRSQSVAVLMAETATWERIYGLLRDVAAYEAFAAEYVGFEIREEDEAAALAIVAWAGERARSGREPYHMMLRRVLRAAEVSRHTFALVCSAVAAYRQDSDRPISTAHLGTVGLRESFVLTLKRIAAVPTKYGTMYRLGFDDPAGNDVVWFSSRAPQAIGIAMDCQLTMTATVRRHDEYRGSLQTIVTRGTLKTELSSSRRKPSIKVKEISA